MARRLSIFAVVLAVALSCRPVQALDAARRAVLIFDQSSGVRVRELVAEHGGSLVLFAPAERTAIVRIDDAGLAAVLSLPEVVAGGRGALTGEEIPALDERSRSAAAAWNRLVLDERLARTFSGPPPPDGSPLIGDALVGPPHWELSAPLSFDTPSSPSATGRPLGAALENTSEYLAGHVALNVLMVESDGSLDPNLSDWTLDMESRIQSETFEALDALVTLYPGSDLSFTVHFYSGRTDARLRTGAEPITRSADPYGATGEDLWGKEVLGKLGYSGASRLTLSRRFADDTRLADASDWALSVFVINSLGDTDGRFADLRFAYAWIGGPHIVTTYANDGWGIARFDMVLRHEMHHSFFALDQYAASNCTCTASAGYLNGVNANCENCNANPEPDVMRHNELAASVSTRTMVGTIDADADGTADVLQVAPSLSVSVESAPEPCTGRTRLAVTPRSVPHPNANPYMVTPHNDITIAAILAVETQFDSGAWEGGWATADDGAFDGPVEPAHVELTVPAGSHTVRVRARDSAGNLSAVHTLGLEGSAGVAGPPSIALRREGSAVRLSWAAVTGASLYRLRRAASPALLEGAAADPDLDAATQSVLDTSSGAVFYDLAAVDACGNETR